MSTDERSTYGATDARERASVRSKCSRIAWKAERLADSRLFFTSVAIEAASEARGVAKRSHRAQRTCTKTRVCASCAWRAVIASSLSNVDLILTNIALRNITKANKNNVHTNTNTFGQFKLPNVLLTRLTERKSVHQTTR